MVDKILSFLYYIINYIFSIKEMSNLLLYEKTMIKLLRNIDYGIVNWEKDYNVISLDIQEVEKMSIDLQKYFKTNKHILDCLLLIDNIFCHIREHVNVAKKASESSLYMPDYNRFNDFDVKEGMMDFESNEKYRKHVTDIVDIIKKEYYIGIKKIIEYIWTGFISIYIFICLILRFISFCLNF